MTDQIYKLYFNSFFRYFLGLFLGLIAGLFILQALYLSSGTTSIHSFLSHWFSMDSFYDALAINTGFVATGIVTMAWFNSRKILKVKIREVENLKKINQEKSEFILFSTHEMRTPITGLKGALQIMLDGKFGSFSDRQRDIITKEYEAVQNLNFLVNELLDISKIENEKMELILKQVELDYLISHIENIVEEFKPIGIQKNIFLNLIKSSLVPQKKLFIDIGRISEITRNIIQNAINYTSIGGNVDVILEMDNQAFKVSIRDTGIGIPEDEKPRIFSKFYRATNARETHSMGTGLGLYLCKKFIEGHNGKIWFLSEKDKGTTFIFTLPFRESLGIEDLFRKI